MGMQFRQIDAAVNKPDFVYAQQHAQLVCEITRKFMTQWRKY